MTRLPFNVVAFDLDGPLADTAPDLAASLNHALTALGRDAIDRGSARSIALPLDGGGLGGMALENRR